jgi:hypothetical protein
MEATKTELEIAGCLRRLLKSRYLVRSRNEKWFQLLVDLRLELDRVLGAMGMALEIQDGLGVAYLRNLSGELEEKIDYQMGRRQSLSAYASALLVKLRHARLEFYLNPSADSVPLIPLGEMREFLQNFSAAKIDSHFERLFRRALDELLDLQVLFATREDSEFYEISPLCEILLPLDAIQETKTRMEAYFAHFQGNDTAAAAGPEGE